MRTRTLFSDEPDTATGQTTVEPQTYHNKSQASRASAESAKTFARSQCARVSEFIAATGDHGCTDKEIQTALNLDGNSQRPRRVWLRANGFIQAKGEPEDIVLRGGATVWVSLRPYGVPTAAN